MVVVIPSNSKSNVAISYNYPASVGNISPCITYDNSYNFPPRWSTNLNVPKTQAYTNITSIWSSGIYCDDNGNVFWTDTYGNVIVAWADLNYYISDLGTPYSHFAYAGPITSIAAVNYSLSFLYGISYVVVLTYYGYVFGYNLNNQTWFNATKLWDLPLANYPVPWTSVTSNTKGYPNYDEGFLFTDLSGNVYLYDTTDTAYSGWLIKNNPNENIVSTAVSYDGYLYGVTYNGNVYYYSSNGWGLYSSTGITHLVGITMNHNKYLYLLQLNNGTTLYKSSTKAGHTNGLFSSYGSVVFSKGTNEAITYDQKNHIFWAIQTNGTRASSSNPSSGWHYSNNLLFKYPYTTVLAINSACFMNFDTYVLYLSSKNITSMLNFTLYFLGSNNLLNLEFYYNRISGLYGNPQTLTLLTSSSGVLINVTMMPNKAYNSTFYFYSVFYPANNQNSVILEYILTINVVNHFSYINC